MIAVTSQTSVAGDGRTCRLAARHRCVARHVRQSKCRTPSGRSCMVAAAHLAASVQTAGAAILANVVLLNVVSRDGFDHTPLVDIVTGRKGVKATAVALNRALSGVRACGSWACEHCGARVERADSQPRVCSCSRTAPHTLPTQAALTVVGLAYLPGFEAQRVALLKMAMFSVWLHALASFVLGKAAQFPELMPPKAVQARQLAGLAAGGMANAMLVMGNFGVGPLATSPLLLCALLLVGAAAHSVIMNAAAIKTKGFRPFVAVPIVICAAALAAVNGVHVA